MKYLVTGSEGPGFASAEEAVAVLEKGILPTFDALTKLEADGKIVAGGLPVGDRAFVFVAEASSNEELDQLLRSIPALGRAQVARHAASEFWRTSGSRTRGRETAQKGPNVINETKSAPLPLSSWQTANRVVANHDPTSDCDDDAVCQLTAHI